MKAYFLALIILSGCSHKKNTEVFWNPKVTWETNKDGNVTASIIETEDAVFILSTNTYFVIRNCTFRTNQ